MSPDTRRGAVQPVYLLVGEEFLVEETLDEIRREAGTEPLSEVLFDAAAEPAGILEALETPSLLGGRRLVVIREAHALDNEQTAAVARYLQAPTEDALLVLVAAGPTPLDASVSKTGRIISLEAPKGRRLVQWIRQRAANLGFKLDGRAPWALIDSVGSELRDLESALAQLLSALGRGSRVDAAEIRRMFPRLAEQAMYVFTDAVGERRLDGALTALRRLLLQGEHPLVLFGALTGHVRRLLRARRHADRGARAVSDAMGLPEWRAERLQRQALRYREDELMAALSVLAATDIEMKATDRPEVALERAVAGIVSGELGALRR